MNRGRRPQYGQPIHKSLEEDGAVLETVKMILGKVEEVMGLIVRTIAGISITEITDEVVVFPVEFIDANMVLLKLQTTPQTQPDKRYVVQLKVDRGAEVEMLPLESIVFSPQDIADRVARTIPFEASFDLSNVEAFISEVFLDEAIAEIHVEEVTAQVGVEIDQSIIMNVGSGGLAGFDIALKIENPAIAEFVGADFPPEFPLSSTVPDPVVGSSFIATGLDLNDVVNAGEVGRLLVTAQIHPLIAGQSAITATILRLDDDDGNPIRAIIAQGSIEVS